MEQKKNSTVTVLLVAIIMILCGVLIYFFFIKDKEETKSTEPEQKQKQDDTKKEPIKYELKKNSENNDELYVNGKKVDISNLVTEKDRLFNVDDEIIIVGDCKSVCDWYLVDKDAAVLGTIGNVQNSTIKRTVLLVPKFENIEVEKVEGKIIYLTDYGFTYQDGSSLCDVEDNSVVYVSEKVEYLGNNKFGTPTTVSSKTKAQIMKEDARFVCE